MNNSFLVAVKPPHQGSSVYFSKFDHDSFFMKCFTPGIAIKYVLSGVENYYHNNSTVSVKAGNYLVLNNEKNF